MFCVIDRNEIPAERAKRKGAAKFCCTNECYEALRRFLRSWDRKIIIRLPGAAQKARRTAHSALQSIVDEMQQ